MVLFCPIHGIQDAETVSHYTVLFLLNSGPKDFPTAVVLHKMAASLDHTIGCSQAGEEASKVLYPGVLHTNKKVLFVSKPAAARKIKDQWP